jgi:hypothetical protein
MATPFEIDYEKLHQFENAYIIYEIPEKVIKLRPAA